MKVALIGFGNVGKAFARLLESQRPRYPFRIAGIHTLNHGTAYKAMEFGPRAATIEEFLDRAGLQLIVDLVKKASGSSVQGHLLLVLKALLNYVNAIEAVKEQLKGTTTLSVPMHEIMV